MFNFREEKKFYKICTNNGKCFLERGCLVRMISCLQIKKRAMIRMEKEREKEKGREGERKERKKRGERERERKGERGREKREKEKGREGERKERKKWRRERKDGCEIVKRIKVRI